MSTMNERYTNNEEEVTSTRRIASIDFVKGLALGFIIFAHAALSWFDSDWVFIYGFAFALLDILGPSLFVFLSALSVIFSIKRKKIASSNKAIRNRIFTRGFVIIVIGVLFNPMSLLTAGESVPFPANLWGWNILMFIGFSQIFSYYALKFSKITRAIAGFIIIFISPWIRQILFQFKNSNFGVNILHFIITSPLPQVPFLPWIAVCFISTIFGEYLFETMQKGTKEAYYRLLRMFVTYGVALVLIGLFMWIPRMGLALDQWEPGWAILNPTPGGTIEYSEYLHIDLLRLANNNVLNLPWPGMPLFMIRSSAHNMFYNLGAALLIIAISFYYIDIKERKNMFIKMLIFYGKVSLSLFLIQFLFLPLFGSQFPITFGPFVFAAYSGFLGLLLYIWLKFFKGVGTPEWIMGKLGSGGKKKNDI